MEAVAGPVEVSTQEGWECPDRALLCVCAREELSGSVQLTWDCTARATRQDMQQQSESVGRLQQVQRVLHEH